MSARLASLNRHLKHYDRELYAARSGHTYQIYRKSYRWDSYEYQGQGLAVLREQPHYIISLTDTWKPDGKPVEWGIEPLLAQIRSMDLWRDRGMYAEMVKKREREERWKEDTRSNNIRAAAIDMKRDLAKATNDINTSTLNKTDIRRLKNGYSK